MTLAASPVLSITGVSWHGGRPAARARTVPEEAAVAFTYNRSTYAVMMASPSDLEDFAIGFSLNERIITAPEEIEELEIVPGEHGIELRMWLGSARTTAFFERRRNLAGPTGCGLCGAESLAEVMRPASKVRGEVQIAADMVRSAMVALSAAQNIHHQTRAVHAAAYWEPGAGLIALREDVGRHNALDKLAGALERESRSAEGGMILLTSRISVELIQKAAVMGTPAVAAISAPTALAVQVAEAAGITLIAVARDDGFEVFTHPHRVLREVTEHVA